MTETEQSQATAETVVEPFAQDNGNKIVAEEAKGDDSHVANGNAEKSEEDAVGRADEPAEEEHHEQEDEAEADALVKHDDTHVYYDEQLYEEEGQYDGPFPANKIADRPASLSCRAAFMSRSGFTGHVGARAFDNLYWAVRAAATINDELFQATLWRPSEYPIHDLMPFNYGPSAQRRSDVKGRKAAKFDVVEPAAPLEGVYVRHIRVTRSLWPLFHSVGCGLTDQDAMRAACGRFLDFFSSTGILTGQECAQLVLHRPPFASVSDALTASATRHFVVVLRQALDIVNMNGWVGAVVKARNAPDASSQLATVRRNLSAALERLARNDTTLVAQLMRQSVTRSRAVWLRVERALAAFQRRTPEMQAAYEIRTFYNVPRFYRALAQRTLDELRVSTRQRTDMTIEEVIEPSLDTDELTWTPEPDEAILKEEQLVHAVVQAGRISTEPHSLRFVAACARRAQTPLEAVFYRVTEKDSDASAIAKSGLTQQPLLACRLHFATLYTTSFFGIGYGLTRRTALRSAASRFLSHLQRQNFLGVQHLARVVAGLYETAEAASSSSEADVVVSTLNAIKEGLKKAKLSPLDTCAKRVEAPAKKVLTQTTEDEAKKWNPEVKEKATDDSEKKPEVDSKEKATEENGSKTENGGGQPKEEVKEEDAVEKSNEKPEQEDDDVEDVELEDEDNDEDEEEGGNTVDPNEPEKDENGTPATPKDAKDAATPKFRRRRSNRTESTAANENGEATAERRQRTPLDGLSAPILRLWLAATEDGVFQPPAYIRSTFSAIPHGGPRQHRATGSTQLERLNKLAKHLENYPTQLGLARFAPYPLDIETERPYPWNERTKTQGATMIDYSTKPPVGRIPALDGVLMTRHDGWQFAFTPSFMAGGSGGGGGGGGGVSSGARGGRANPVHQLPRVRVGIPPGAGGAPIGGTGARTVQEAARNSWLAHQARNMPFQGSQPGFDLRKRPFEDSWVTPFPSAHGGAGPGGSFPKRGRR